MSQVDFNASIDVLKDTVEVKKGKNPISGHISAYPCDNCLLIDRGVKYLICKFSLYA